MKIIIRHTWRGRERELGLSVTKLLAFMGGVVIVGALLQATVPAPAGAPLPAGLAPLGASVLPAAEASVAMAESDQTTAMAAPAAGGSGEGLRPPAGITDASERLPGDLDSPDLVAADETAAGGNWLLNATEYWSAHAQAGGPAQGLRPSNKPADSIDSDPGLQDNLDLMARKIGEMEARLMQLDALGARLAEQAGVPPESFDFQATPGQGGLLVAPQPMSLTDLEEGLASLDGRLSDRADYLSVLDARMATDSAMRQRTPTAMPIRGYTYNSSSYGPRVDPISGRRAFHEGLDFAAPRGTPILAAAGGVVIDARYHPAYGNVVDIDHGNKTITRYAHAQRLLVRKGDLVRPGQRIGLVGSTGRSTGAHLHFEVRIAGRAADPRLFLLPGGDTRLARASGQR